jgi:HAD superfamily hydrolase (TIGR01509 family)
MSIMDGLKAVVFDLDGLMIDSEPIALAVWRDVLTPYDVELSAEVYSRVIGLEPRRGAEMMVDTFDLPLSVDELLETYWAHRTKIMERSIEPQPGLLDLVEIIAGAGYLLAVASNSPLFYVRRILAAIGLIERIPCIVGSDQVQSGKPAPDVYLAAAECLQIDPELCLAIEDSPAGVMAASAAGMRTIVIPNPELSGRDFSQADFQFESLETLRQRLRSEVNSA